MQAAGPGPAAGAPVPGEPSSEALSKPPSRPPSGQVSQVSRVSRGSGRAPRGPGWGYGGFVDVTSTEPSPDDWDADGYDSFAPDDGDGTRPMSGRWVRRGTADHPAGDLAAMNPARPVAWLLEQEAGPC